METRVKGPMIFVPRYYVSIKAKMKLGFFQRGIQGVGECADAKRWWSGTFPGRNKTTATTSNYLLLLKPSGDYADLMTPPT